MNDITRALLVMVKTPHIRTYLVAMGEITEPGELSDEGLESIILAGTSARKVLATRINERLDEREKELAAEIRRQEVEIATVTAIAQKQIDKVLAAMEAKLSKVYVELKSVTDANNIEKE
jgi:DNA-binding sugar fermentation-stimulating protein